MGSVEETIPVNVLSRPKLGTGVSGKCAFREVDDIGAAIFGRAHLSEAVAQVPADVGIDGELACCDRKVQRNDRMER